MRGQELPDAARLRGTGGPAPDIRIYPFVAVMVKDGGLGLGDATHHLSVTLPAQGRELLLPFNQQAIRRLRRELDAAAGTAP